ncbi:MAG: phosphoribosylanthranilate isomerase [Lachnospiraceae bacterium]|nr:phosphoribosylanthranilate isomerase [Lachnospiraceae bacterium]
MTKIKICGLFRECDIDYVNEACPDYIGFILNFPKSHRNVTPETAKNLKSRLSPDIRAVGVFVNQEIEYVIDAARTIGLDVIQLHGTEDNEYIKKLRERIDGAITGNKHNGSGNIQIWKAFKIQASEDLENARKCIADEILLDNGYGTGKAFDWSIAGGFDREFCLAGGLNPDNVSEAIKQLKPKLVDISSGVETDKVKDKEKILKAVKAVRG